MSISFDRAAPYYDQTRAIPTDVSEKITQSILDIAHATRDSRFLEIGIGTGRVAFPLIKRGYRVTGIDISLAMMEQLIRKLAHFSLGRDSYVTNGSQPKRKDEIHLESSDAFAGSLGLAQAEMGRLPFVSDHFDDALAVHVLHLSPAWREAIAEARRVLKPGGTLLASWHHRERRSPNRILRSKLAELAQQHGVSMKSPGAVGNEEIRAELEKWGTRVEVITVVEWEEVTTVAEVLDEIDRQIFSDTWRVPRTVLDQLMPRLREFARVEFGDVERIVVEPAIFKWIVAHK